MGPLRSCWFEILTFSLLHWGQHLSVVEVAKGSAFEKQTFTVGVSKNRGGKTTPNHPFLIGFSITNHPFWGTIIFGNTH